jgi:hypothetical protein
MSNAKGSVSKTGRRARASNGWVVGLLFGLLAACGEESASKRGTLTLPVDASLAPAQPTIGARSLARMVGESGIAMDFVLGEVIVATDDQAKLDAFVARWGGSVVNSTERVGDVPRVHQVKLDPSGADVDKLVAELNANVPELRGTFRTSSDAAAKLIAVALSEANAKGMTVSPNFVVPPAAIADGTTTEAPTGDDALYTPNAFAWPYMNRGSAQDIGVGSAWQMMQRAGVFRNKVRMMVIDGGFMENAEVPATRRIFGHWNAPSLLKCGGNVDCPWHGSMVVSAAMGTLDDGQGAAGPAAPVAELIAMPLESDFFALMFTVERLISATVVGNPQIVNMSLGFELDLGWDIAVKVACLGLCPSISEAFGGITGAVAATNKLIFASAGNAGKDVDNAGGSPEGSTFIPCELPGVICVGGMAHNSTRRDPGSNFGSRADDSSVDIYGPWATWVGTDPDNRSNHARLVTGTSFSSPFVAGVAALIWASRPSLSAGDVWRIMHDTAHVGGVHDGGGNQRRVNAHAAVASLLAGSPPTLALNTSGPTAPINRDYAVTAVVNDDGNPCPPSACPLTFDPPPARISGNTAYYRASVPGARTITVTARDAADQVVTATTTVNFVNAPPVVTITTPLPGATVQQGVAVQLLGSATDENEGDGPGPGNIGCAWSSSIPGETFPVDVCNHTISFATQGPRTLTLRATDPQGETTSTSVTINVTAPPTNFPPTIGTTTRTPTAVNYDAGFGWTTPFTLTTSATDPEGNTPISYVWKATSFRPKTTTAFVSDVTLGSSTSITWTPSTTPTLFGTFADFGNDCYSGQTVRVRVEATDSLGNKSTKTLPDFTVYRCILE